MLESLFNKATGLQTCNVIKMRLQHRRFPENIANFKNTYFEKHLRTTASDSSYIMHRKLNKNFQGPNLLLLILKHKITLFYLLSFAFIRFITRCHSLSLIVIFCYSLSLVVICCHLLYHLLSLTVSRCHLLYHSLSFVVIRCTLVVIRCHSMYHSSVFHKRTLIYNFKTYGLCIFFIFNLSNIFCLYFL